MLPMHATYASLASSEAPRPRDAPTHAHDADSPPPRAGVSKGVLRIDPEHTRPHSEHLLQAGQFSYAEKPLVNVEWLCA